MIKEVSEWDILQVLLNTLPKYRITNSKKL